MSTATLRANEMFANELRKLADWIDANAATIPPAVLAIVEAETADADGVDAFARVHTTTGTHVDHNGRVAAMRWFGGLLAFRVRADGRST